MVKQILLERENILKKILIGYISYGEDNGITRYLLDVARMLSREGIQVDFLASALENDVKQKLQSEGFTLYEIASLKHPLRHYRQIKRICADGTYDAAYFNISEALNCLGIMAAKHSGIRKIIVHSHSGGINKRNILIRNLRYLFHLLGKYGVIPFCATDFYACSSNAGEWLFPQFIIKSTSFYIINNAVDLSKFHFDQEIRSNVRQEMNVGERKVVGYIGGFTYAKNYLFMVEIAKELVKNSEIEFWCIGGGYDCLVQEARDSIAKSEYQERIRMLGVRSDVSDLMQAMDALVLPSLFEGMPFVAIEAQATGLAVFLSQRISREAKVTKHAYFLDIDDSAKEWASFIQDHLEYQRVQTDIEGFDLNTQQLRLKEILMKEQ